MHSAKYRHALPQMGDEMLLTDGGLETTLIFEDGIELPYFAAFDLLRTSEGRARLAAYYTRYIGIAHDADLGLVLDSATWRASPDWGARLGLRPEALADANREAVRLLMELRATHERARPFVVSGNIGPRGDGYSPEAVMRPDAAHAYHAPQIATLAEAGVDMLTVLTMTHAFEAAGIARAAAEAGVPAAISFTVETDGRLPSGQPLGDAIAEVDADCPPAYYMINCAHPDHFRDALAGGEGWTHRIRGIRANASRLSHAELDEAETLDDGDPVEFGRDHAALMRLLPALRVIGGCCGTDHRHVRAVADACGRHLAA